MPPRRTPPSRAPARSSSRTSAPRHPRLQRIRRLGVIALRVALYGALLLIGIYVGLLSAALPVLDQFEKSTEFRQREGLIFARNGKTILRHLRAPTTRTYAADGDIPPVLADAVVASEDRRFYEHNGVDIRGIARAAWVDIRAREKREGGSTITQQLVKNAYVGPEQSIGRKTREALIAVALEARWSKSRILTAYLNTAYFGQGQYGIIDAARTWTARTPARLRPADAALLAALLRAPERDNPLASPVRARAERNRVLNAMRDTDKLTAIEYQKALATPIPARAGILARTKTKGELAPHFTDSVVSQLVERYGVRRALGSGLRVRTTLDARMQKAAIRAVRQLSGTGLSTALVAIDPSNGQVRAMVLGGPARSAAFNIATQGHRQPGSAFKPFTLAAAFDSGYTPDTHVLSAPYHSVFDGKGFNVRNSEGSYNGTITMAQATWSSDNTAYARIAADIGIDHTIDAARAAGITSKIDDVPATVLGALPHGVTPRELAAAYATFANHGTRAGSGAEARPRELLRVDEPGTGAIYRAGTVKIDAIPRPIADQVTDVLRGVIIRGTATRAAIGRPVAGKTGTTDNYADAWFAGYTPDLAVAIWVGHPEGAIPMRTEYHGGPVYGGTWPAQIFADFMRDAFDGKPIHAFDLKRPEYESARVDPLTGLLASDWCANAEEQQFPKGDAPTDVSKTCPSLERELPDVQGLTLEAATEQLTEFGVLITTRTVGRIPGSEGLVIAQRPAGGTKVTRNSTVELVASR